MSLSPELKASYVSIIDGILRASDLDQISAKKVRQGLQAALGGREISASKETLKELIHERFDVIYGNQPAEAPPSPRNAPLVNGSGPQVNGDSKPVQKQLLKQPPPASGSPPKRSSPSEESSEASDESPKKKVKKNAKTSDAALAARLQAEENTRARPTRGGTSRKRAPVQKKTPKKKNKSADKVGADDDSELEDGSDEEKPKKRNGAFHKPMTLSAPLSQLVGETTLSRPQTVKKIWEYVKANGLQNQNDKRQIICDDAMRAVFKQDTVHMFTMNKILSNNLYEIDE